MDELHCNACGKHFSTKYNLRKHVEALHLKLKPFGCPLCARHFAYLHSHTQHLQAHLRAKRRPAALIQTQTTKALGRLLALEHDCSPLTPPPSLQTTVSQDPSLQGADRPSLPHVRSA